VYVEVFERDRGEMATLRLGEVVKSGLCCLCFVRRYFWTFHRKRYALEICINLDIRIYGVWECRLRHIDVFRWLKKDERF
jgi:hypothetical protein